MNAARTQKILTVLAFFAIYVLWGSTYLAIRMAVATVPPFLAAGIRFTLAGGILLSYAVLRRMPAPAAIEWRNLAISAAILFVPSYAGLFWAEKTVPSGIASAVVSTIPVWMALIEVLVLKQAKLRWQLIASFVCGIGGVSILTVRGTSGTTHSVLPYIIMLATQITWSIGTLLTKNMRLPPSKPLVAGAQMAIGGLLLLLLSGAAGEMHPFPHISVQAALAILYLTIAGSVIAFTAYLWLLAHLPATTVASYAYVNPVVAIALGYWLGNETLDLRVFAGTFLVLVGVVLILKTKRAT
jgi:drug/metabolite transporter (DMT)-like permease